VLPTRSSDAIRSRPVTTPSTQRIAVVAPLILLASSRESPMSLISGLIGVGCPFAPGGVIAARTLERLERSSGVTLKEAGSGLREPGSCAVMSSRCSSFSRWLRMSFAWSFETNWTDCTCGIVSSFAFRAATWSGGACCPTVPVGSGWPDESTSLRKSRSPT
jgi:hypothetical protein